VANLDAIYRVIHHPTGFVVHDFDREDSAIRCAEDENEEYPDSHVVVKYVRADLQAPPAAAVPAANVTPMRQPRADLARLVESINAAVYANGDGLSVTEAIGALELAKLELLKEQEQ